VSAACLRRLPVLLLILCSALPARAQLADSFYNVTGIQTRVLPNAVQVTIQTDGSALFGGDTADFINIEGGRYEPKPITSFRLRLANARARIPAFVDIGAYPFDAAVVTPGREEFAQPFFSLGGEAQAEPRVDIEIRFFVPITVQRFMVEPTGYGIAFRNVLGPREVGVEMGIDRRTIVITVITDRSDVRGATTIRRSPPENHKHHLTVTPVARPQTPSAAATGSTPAGTASRTARCRVDALHTPLVGVLQAVSRVVGMKFVAQLDAAEVDVSMLLPAVTAEEFLRALARGYGLSAMPRSDADGGGFVVGRSGAVTATERLQLRYLSPERARLLFPDFLLPLLRADKENNALLMTGSPELIARVRRDLSLLDLPRPQVRVEATVWELATSDDLSTALRVTNTSGETTASINTGSGEYSVRVEENQQRALTVALEALRARGRARLAAKPFVVVASGERGTLFLGQNRYIQVRQQSGGQQVEQAISLPIGYSLTVLPRVGASDDITLELNPRVSTIDSVENGTGLPTVGIRETNSVLRVRAGEAVVVAGLDSDLNFDTRRSPFAAALAGAARRSSKSQTSLLLLVTARKV